MAYETLTFRPSKENSELLVHLAELAKQDNRKLNNYIETILLNWIKNNPVNLPVGGQKSFKKKR
jgi:DNA replication protein DnaD